MRARTWTSAVLVGTAWIGANGCGASAKMGAAPAPAAEMAMREPMAAGPGAEQAAQGEPLPPKERMTIARPGGAVGDAAELNARKQGEWHVVREFPVATYDPADTGPRSDFRETIFWAPSVKTDAEGRARIQFPTSDAITSFRIIAEGLAAGVPGHAEASIASKLPLALAANLPVEVTTGDRIALPVTITNNTGKAVTAKLRAGAGGALAVAGGAAERSIWIPARGARTVTYQLAVSGLDGAKGAGDIELAVEAGATKDSLRRSLKIVPNGFPAAQSFAGSLTESARHTVTLPATAVAGSARTTIKLYPSPVATMVSAVESIVREPSGCFEQASSSNYPNVMVLSYLSTQTQAGSSAAIASETTAKLDRGYQLLTGYETTSKGFEWFGKEPGHEALSAYGLMQFREMAKVYPGLDPKLVDRTAAWLRTRRDGKGGYKRNERALDSFGAASPDVTDAYITYALAEAGETDLAVELARARDKAKQSSDPYVLALSAGALLAANAQDPDGTAGLARLAKLQAPDGRFPGAGHSITKSGGKSLELETTALAALAMMKTKGTYGANINSALRWMTEQRSQWGGYGSTQATILSLKALTVHAKDAAPPAAGARVTLVVNGTDVATVGLDQAEGAIELPDVGAQLRAGDNVIELRGAKGGKLEYTVGATWFDRAPATSAKAPVAVTAALDRTRVYVGGGVKLVATLANRTDKGQPMTMARVGLPGGLKFQPWQLDELVARGTVDFVETREREVILYFRQMKPNEKRVVPIQLLAQVPGRYVGPPSSAYLYYTDEHRQYQRPLTVEVLPPPPPAIKKPPVTLTTPATTKS